MMMNLKDLFNQGKLRAHNITFKFCYQYYELIYLKSIRNGIVAYRDNIITIIINISKDTYFWYYDYWE